MHLSLTLDPLSTLAVDAVARSCGTVITRFSDADVLRDAGPQALEAARLLRETMRSRRLEAGEAVTTTGGDLPATWIIHVVVPAYDLHTSREHLLRQAYRSMLAAADAVGATTLALHPLGTSEPCYWPLDIAVRAVTGVLPNTPTRVRDVRLALRTPAGLEPFAEALLRR